MNGYFSSFLLLIVGLSSCQQGHFYEKNIVIAEGKWTSEHKPSFEIKVDDNQNRYDVYVNLRHNASYPFSNLSLSLNEKGPRLNDTAGKYQLKLADRDGRWIGNSAGSLYEQSVLIKENFIFPDTGKYVFSIQQTMCENALPGIHDVGLTLIKK